MLAASQTCSTGTTISLDDFGRNVASRVKAAGFPVMPRNAGNRRTESKRAMLAELESMGADW